MWLELSAIETLFKVQNLNDSRHQRSSLLHQIAPPAGTQRMASGPEVDRRSSGSCQMLSPSVVVVQMAPPAGAQRMASGPEAVPARCCPPPP